MQQQHTRTLESHQFPTYVASNHRSHPSYSFSIILPPLYPPSALPEAPVDCAPIHINLRMRKLFKKGKRGESWQKWLGKTDAVNVVRNELRDGRSSNIFIRHKMYNKTLSVEDSFMKE